MDLSEDIFTDNIVKLDIISLLDGTINTSNRLEPWRLGGRAKTRPNHARRRIALGLPPVEARSRREEDTDDLEDKPAIYDVCLVFREGAGGEQLRWDQMRALSSTRVLSLPAQPKAEEMRDSFKNYLTSFMELVSVERMDKVLLKAAAKDRPREYTKSELVTSVMITMPQLRRGLTAENGGLTELELGVYEVERGLPRPRPFELPSPVEAFPTTAHLILMSSSTVPSSEASPSTSPEPDPWTVHAQDFGSDNQSGHAFFTAGIAVFVVIALLIACAVIRIRMVRRRRRALGLPQPDSRRSAKRDLEELGPKPQLHKAWVVSSEDGYDIDQSSLQWKELRPLALSQILSQPIPRKAEEKQNPFKNYSASFLELFSVERMDKALMESVRKEDPPPKYTKSELVATVFIAMPQSPGYDSMADISLLPELEFGVYHAPSVIQSDLV
ncbi:hypothetical protein FRC05_000384 [Tulasnella sp. 425]|nr:hypothetical protein FRC05_000384 [Tulasnella sp. 425]